MLTCFNNKRADLSFQRDPGEVIYKANKLNSHNVEA